MVSLVNKNGSVNATVYCRCILSTENHLGCIRENKKTKCCKNKDCFEIENAISTIVPLPSELSKINGMKYKLTLNVEKF